MESRHLFLAVFAIVFASCSGTTKSIKLSTINLPSIKSLEGKSRICTLKFEDFSFSGGPKVSQEFKNIDTMINGTIEAALRRTSVCKIVDRKPDFILSGDVTSFKYKVGSPITTPVLVGIGGGLMVLGTGLALGANSGEWGDVAIGINGGMAGTGVIMALIGSALPKEMTSEIIVAARITEAKRNKQIWSKKYEKTHWSKQSTPKSWEGIEKRIPEKAHIVTNAKLILQEIVSDVSNVLLEVDLEQTSKSNIEHEGDAESKNGNDDNTEEKVEVQEKHEEEKQVKTSFEKLKELKRMLDEKYITREEYDSKKMEILKDM